MEKCSRCGKILDDFKINIDFNIKVHRKKNDAIWEYIPNLDHPSKEILCIDCFNKFAELMGEMNIKYHG